MRLHSLDSARGIAALAVVAYHFQHLAAFGQDPFSWKVDEAALPFFAVLRPIYLYGWMAVDLFFVISGFVFFWIYQQAIRDRTIDIRSFFILRLTRLYPLHVLTLSLVVLLQFVYGSALGRFFVIPYNDAYHLWLNVFFLQSWGLESGPSFNGPSWSISVEILLYLVFFLFCAQRFSRSAGAVLGMVCLGLLVQFVSPIVGRGIAGFFAGGLMFHALAATMRHPEARTIVRRVTALTAILWLTIVAATYLDAIGWALRAMGGTAYAGLVGKAASRLILHVAFPLGVFSLAASEQVLGHRWRFASLLGDISYASYLMHFPLQLVFACLAAYGLLSQGALTGPGCLLAFFVVLIPLSWATYRGFELPMQRLGRRALLARRPGAGRDGATPAAAADGRSA